MKPVSASNTKNEILEGYQQLMAQYDDEKKQNKSLLKQLEDKEKLIANAQKASESGDASLEDLKATFVKQVDDFKIKLDEEKGKFNALQAALTVQKDELENLHSIKAQAESLDALIITNKLAKEKLAQEITDTKLSWEREEEAFEYNLKIKRRNDEDAYQQRKAKLEADLKEKKDTFEREMLERENAVKEKETAFAEMETKVKSYENKLSILAVETEKEVTDRLTKEFDFNKRLENKDLETEIKLLKLEIETLKAKVKEQNDVIATLNSKTTEAGKQVQEIALKAIEGSGKRIEVVSSDKNITDKN